MATSPRQSKRPFQPSITSFFGRRDSNELSFDRSTSRPSIEPLKAPTLPATVQSSLLNVGMRIRKSVPEGYKNRAEAKWRTNIAHDHQLDQASLFYVGESPARVPTKFSEVAPFCGIHKVGGHAVQFTTVEPAYQLPPLQFDDEESNFMGSSQESQTSTISTDSMPPGFSRLERGMHKRRFDDDEDVCEPLIFEDVDPHSMHSRGNPVSHTSMPKLNSIRPLAHPKTRRRYHVATPRKGHRVEDQENSWAGVLEAPIDFDEADFLHPPSPDQHEVEMSGV